MAATANIVVLTGAGISKESGLDTFRDKDGLWAKVRLEEVATATAMRRDRGRVNDFFNHLRRGMLDDSVQPNAAHRALAELEAKWPGEVLVVTQNVDDLHERAGSRNVLHMHGSLLHARCLRCDDVADWRSDILPQSVCSGCGVAGELRPDIVLFEEMPHGLERIDEALAGCGLFISIGTSGNVYPAAGFVAAVRMQGRAMSVELNLEPSSNAHQFDEQLYGPASEVVPGFVRQWLAAHGR